ncbi:MAG: peptidylprolyl isomerase [Cellulosilyticaceae bacterium]
MKEKKALLGIIGGLVVLALVFVIGTNMGGSKESPAPNQENNVVFVDEMEFEGAALPVATITVKGYGDLVAELYPGIAPNTVANFIALANEGFYDGLTIHRVVEDFVIQGGDPMGTGMGGPGYTIKGEFVENGHTANILSHTQGVLSMARRGDGNDTAGSQFFVVTSDAKSLDGKYAAFGKMTEGYDILAELNRASVISVQTGQPTVPIVIERITIDTKGQTYHEPEVIDAQ